MPTIKYTIEVEREGKWVHSVKFPRLLSKKSLRAILPIPQGYRMAAVEMPPPEILGIAEGDVVEPGIRVRSNPNSRIPNGGEYYLEFLENTGRWMRSVCPNQPTPYDAFSRARNRDFECAQLIDYRIRREGHSEPIPIPAQRFRLERFGRRSTSGQWLPSRHGDHDTQAEVQADLNRRHARYPHLRYRIVPYDVITDPSQEGSVSPVPTILVLQPGDWYIETQPVGQYDVPWVLCPDMGVFTTRRAAQSAADTRYAAEGRVNNYRWREYSYTDSEDAASEEPEENE